MSKQIKLVGTFWGSKIDNKYKEKDSVLAFKAGNMPEGWKDENTPYFFMGERVAYGNGYDTSFVKYLSEYLELPVDQLDNERLTVEITITKRK